MAALPPGPRNPIKFQLGEINKANLGALRELNKVSFPIKYAESFYSDLLLNIDFSRYCFVADVIVGAVCCRLQSIDEENGAGEPFLVADDPPERLEAQQKLVDDACTPKQLYIMTLSCLPAYRRRGLASSLLNFVLEGVKKRKDVKEIGLHVQVTNEEAIAFYEKHGFHKKKEIPDYYTAIQPTAAYYLAYTVDVQ